MGIETLVISTLAATAAAGGYQGYQANKQLQAFKAAGEEQKSLANKAAEQAKINANQAAMRIYARRGATGEAGMRDTILTSPLGAPSAQTQAGGKTLLGA